MSDSATENEGGEDESHRRAQARRVENPAIVTGGTVQIITDEPVESNPTVKLAPQPTHQLRLWTLWILVGIVGVGIAVVTAGLAAHWFDTDFAKTILQTVVSPVLGALSAVVGYLFADRKGH